MAEYHDRPARELPRRRLDPAVRARRPQQARGGAEQRADHPLRDRDVAAAARAAQHGARRDEGLDPVRAGRQRLHDLDVGGARQRLEHGAVLAGGDDERGAGQVVGGERPHVGFRRRERAHGLDGIAGDGGDHERVSLRGCSIAARLPITRTCPTTRPSRSRT